MIHLCGEFHSEVIFALVFRPEGRIMAPPHCWLCPWHPRSKQEPKPKEFKAASISYCTDKEKSVRIFRGFRTVITPATATSFR